MKLCNFVLFFEQNKNVTRVTVTNEKKCQLHTQSLFCKGYSNFFKYVFIFIEVERHLSFNFYTTFIQFTKLTQKLGRDSRDKKT